MCQHTVREGTVYMHTEWWVSVQTSREAAASLSTVGHFCDCSVCVCVCSCVFVKMRRVPTSIHCL